MDIVRTDETEKLRKFLDHGLYEFNKSHNTNIINPSDKKDFGFEIFDKDELVGGVCGYIDSGNWLWVEYLYINEKCRGKDLGTELMGKIESFASENKCIGIHLYTWAWQARGFYEKHGFSCYGTLENHPLGSRAYYLGKQIAI